MRHSEPRRDQKIRPEFSLRGVNSGFGILIVTHEFPALQETDRAQA